MKPYFSILAALLLCLSASTLKAQIVNIPDQVFKNYLISSSVNTTVDSEIDSLEALNFIGTINISGLNITDLTGLERLVGLRVFGCIGVPITSLDLSANVMLHTLDCGGFLTSLDLSANTMLSWLTCSNSPLTSLDLSNNVNLTYLNCYNLKITSLDLSNNVNLANVQITSDSLLVSLNLKNGNNTAITYNGFFVYDNPLLTCIEVDDSLYSATNWTYFPTGTTTFNNFSTNCLYLGTAQLEQDIPNIQLYPNPTQNTLTIDLGATHSAVNINVLNAIGQSVQSVNYNNTQTVDLNIEGVSGWYFIQIETEKRSHTIKVLKQ
jgi:hypothetical protein